MLTVRAMGWDTLRDDKICPSSVANDGRIEGRKILYN
jgi:hypothetical protein